MSSTSPSDVLLHLILTELKKTPFYNVNVPLDSIKVQLAKINPMILGQLTTDLGVSGSGPLAQMVQTITDAVKTLLNNGRITLDDAPAFMGIINKVYDDVGQISGVSVQVDQLVDVTKDVIEIVLTLVVLDPASLKNLIDLAGAAAALIKFVMPSQSFWDKLCPCAGQPKVKN